LFGQVIGIQKLPIDSIIGHSFDGQEVLVVHFATGFFS
jgi:hypothetical protein